MDEKDDSQKAISDHQDDKADDISSPAIVLKGILSKRSRNLFIRGPWALRTVLLYSNNKFFYFNGKVLKGEVSLAGTEVSFVSPELADGRNYAFQIANIKTEKRVQSSTLIFAAGSQQEAEDWVYNLSAAVKSLDTLSKTAYITFEELAAAEGSALKPLDVKTIKANRQRIYQEKQLRENDYNEEDSESGETPLFQHP